MIFFLNSNDNKTNLEWKIYWNMCETIKFVNEFVNQCPKYLIFFDSNFNRTSVFRLLADGGKTHRKPSKR